MSIVSSEARRATAGKDSTAYKYIRLRSSLLVLFLVGSALIIFRHLTLSRGLNALGTVVDDDEDNPSGNALLSLCYSWLTEDSSLCDTVAWYLPHPTPRRDDSFEYSVNVLSMETREAKMKRNLHQLVPYTTIPAFETKTHVLDTSDTKSDWDWLDKRMRSAYIVDDPIYPGEAACTLGHRRLLEDFLHTSNKQVTLVLEDDAVPTHHKMVLSQLDEVIEAVSTADEDWDYVQLGRCWDIQCHGHASLQPIATLSNGVSLLPSQGFEFCSHSYLVSRRGAEKILQYTLPLVLPYVSTLRNTSRRKEEIYPSFSFLTCCYS